MQIYHNLNHNKTHKKQYNEYKVGGEIKENLFLKS